jgi:hypothetical protein
VRTTVLPVDVTDCTLRFVDPALTAKVEVSAVVAWMGVLKVKVICIPPVDTAVELSAGGVLSCVELLVTVIAGEIVAASFP